MSRTASASCHAIISSREARGRISAGKEGRKEKGVGEDGGRGRGGKGGKGDKGRREASKEGKEGVNKGEAIGN